MFILKENGLYAVACADLKDIKLLARIGSQGIKRLENGKAILVRLVNSNLLPEGKY